MSASDGPEMQAIVERNLEFIRRQLLRQTPFLNAAALTSAIAEAERAIKGLLRGEVVATANSRARFDFFKKLPAELRNRIYEFVILGHSDLDWLLDGSDREDDDYVCIQNLRIVEEIGDFYCGNRSHCTARQNTERVRRRNAMPPPITHVCRQMRNETLPIYYGAKIFTAYVDIKNAPDYLRRNVVAGVTDWLQHVGRKQIPDDQALAH